MGGCASKKIILLQQQDHSSKKPTTSSSPRLSNSVVKVVDINGELQEFDGPILAKEVTSSNPSCFVCSAETMLIDSFVPCLSDRDMLEPGHLYFLMPESKSKRPLSLEDLCALAIKASSNICIDDLQVSFRHGK